jgi:putative transposase
MNSVMERWIGSCRRELLDRTLVLNQRHLMILLREYEDFYNRHRPHRTLNQAAPPPCATTPAAQLATPNDHEMLTGSAEAWPFRAAVLVRRHR